MTHYIWIENNKINGAGESNQPEVINYIPSEELYNDFKTLKTVEEQNAKYMWNGTDVVNNPDYEEMQANKRREQFNKDFFQTSLGYIRRKVSMKTGETKDFLTDLLPVISMAVNQQQPVQIITYKEPDFTKEITDWESLQEIKLATPVFIQECFNQVSTDFTGI